MIVRLRQTLVLLVGLLLITAMVLLGIWQLDVYHSQGRAASERRATGTPVALTAVAPVGAAVEDGFGRPVSFSGTYDPTLQASVPVTDVPGQFRVLTALRQSDGSLVPVVRGLTTSATPPPPPTGQVQQVGVLLPSEAANSAPDPAPGQITAIQLPILAQQWPGPLVGGIVTLSAADATAQGLPPVPVVLPDSPGRLRNGAYAFQWWLFAAFVLVMAIRIVRDLGRLADQDALTEATGNPPDPDPTAGSPLERASDPETSPTPT